jgi:hypothetical protein
MLSSGCCSSLLLSTEIRWFWSGASAPGLESSFLDPASYQGMSAGAVYHEKTTICAICDRLGSRHGDSSRPEASGAAMLRHRDGAHGLSTRRYGAQTAIRLGIGGKPGWGQILAAELKGPVTTLASFPRPSHRRVPPGNTAKVPCWRKNTCSTEKGSRRRPP